MGPLESAVKNVLSVEKDTELLNKFAEEQHRLKFKDDKHSQNGNAFNYFDEVTLEDEKTIIIHYRWGAGDYDYTDSFAVDMTEFYRDEKLKTIIDEL